jgi:hypothetical protein
VPLARDERRGRGHADAHWDATIEGTEDIASAGASTAPAVQNLIRQRFLTCDDDRKSFVEISYNGQELNSNRQEQP